MSQYKIKSDRSWNGTGMDGGSAVERVERVEKEIREGGVWILRMLHACMTFQTSRFVNNVF